MRITSVYLGLVSAAIILSLVPSAEARPNWLQPKRIKEDVNITPRAYDLYERDPQAYNSYSHPGYGPYPTIQPPPSSSTSSETTSNSGEKTTISTKSTGIWD
jgi:hypothetical protein